MRSIGPRPTFTSCLLRYRSADDPGGKWGCHRHGGNDRCGRARGSSGRLRAGAHRRPGLPGPNASRIHPESRMERQRRFTLAPFKSFKGPNWTCPPNAVPAGFTLALFRFILLLRAGATRRIPFLDSESCSHHRLRHANSRVRASSRVNGAVGNGEAWASGRHLRRIRLVTPSGGAAASR